MDTGRNYWFPAKRYGWGWGLPTSWEGWIVLAVYFALLIAGFFIYPPAKAVDHFVAYTAVLSVLLFAVCWLTGEPPRWRWGDD